ncbi:hypothetical protein [Sphingomonas sp.]|uniref:hypothetical protein n=1 Tax=Sphingomonas sp. TaxID=28214 RepID=UPI002E2EEFED|nr:hypothetical protein [Sphingomonas sp.]HEX4693411.1 hypothetical protein [Sphingomonas sp.]
MSTDVTVINIESMQQSATDSGLGPIPPGTTPADGLALLQKQLLANITKDWPTDYPTPASNAQDMGIMGPWSDNVAGTAPPCLVQQITQDFSAWQLPSDAAPVNAMAQQITQEVSSRGGATGAFTGTTELGGSENIYWGVGFGTGDITEGSPGNPAEKGIIYAFTATLGFD